MDLNDWRTKIDEVDRKLVALLNRRARYVLEIARLKKPRGLPIYGPQREKEVFRNVASANGGPLDQGALRGVFKRILYQSRSIQRLAMKPTGREELNRATGPVRTGGKKKRRKKAR